MKRVIERLPEHTYARKPFSTALVQSGQPDRATARLADMKVGDDPLLQSLHGDIAMRKGDYTAARQHLEKATELAPGQPILLVELAKSRGGDNEGAVEALHKAAGSTPPRSNRMSCRSRPT